jgi:hypothetical protein
MSGGRIKRRHYLTMRRTVVGLVLEVNQGRNLRKIEGPAEWN